jgi:hypothetical protein
MKSTVWSSIFLISLTPGDVDAHRALVGWLDAAEGEDHVVGGEGRAVEGTSRPCAVRNAPASG